ncbi:helix-turn-helix domain-containing protein [Streptomyces sp. NPDC056296]|uniref:helix-turn-helix domain-containing protein n=1 Tax=Streptomyces sp. NPDC056296 TaxID=3345775 RepID=UPI0035D5747B
MNTATRLFREFGYYDVSMDDIAEMAGVTVPTVYAHFADAAALLIERAGPREPDGSTKSSPARWRTR